MAQPNYDTDPGLIWRPSLKAPKHAATVTRDGDGWIGRCPHGCDFTPRTDHGDAMIDTMNHRQELK
jgi:hypothetical protein